MVILASEEICNEYAAQTTFFQNQAFPAEKNENPDFIWVLMFKKARCVKKVNNWQLTLGYSI